MDLNDIVRRIDSEVRCAPPATPECVYSDPDFRPNMPAADTEGVYSDPDFRPKVTAADTEGVHSDPDFPPNVRV